MTPSTYTVHEVDPNTMVPVRPLYTGRTHQECVAVIRELLDRYRWRLDNLGLIDDSTGRHCSFVVKR